MRGTEKKRGEQKYMRHFLHKMRSLEVSRCSRAKLRQRNVQKKVCYTWKVIFLLIRPIVYCCCCLPFSSPSPSVNRYTINESFPLKPMLNLYIYESEHDHRSKNVQPRRLKKNRQVWIFSGSLSTDCRLFIPLHDDHVPSDHLYAQFKISFISYISIH